ERTGNNECITEVPGHDAQDGGVCGWGSEPEELALSTEQAVGNAEDEHQIGSKPAPFCELQRAGECGDHPAKNNERDPDTVMRLLCEWSSGFVLHFERAVMGSIQCQVLATICEDLDPISRLLLGVGVGLGLL